MNLKEKAKGLPQSPGVYVMKDSQGSILYVGKSKNLKNRVQSYLQSSKHHSNKVLKLVNHLQDFDYIVTDTEFEAFLLECQLIKKRKPLYNKLMKSPESYTYLVIRNNQAVPSIELSHDFNFIQQKSPTSISGGMNANWYSNSVWGCKPLLNKVKASGVDMRFSEVVFRASPKKSGRKYAKAHLIEQDGNLYFGPFSSKSRTERAIQGLKEFFKIECSHPSNQKTPCLNYSIGLCMGICFDSTAVETYNQIIKRIIALLSGTDTSILSEMEDSMVEAAKKFDFEKAAKLRDSIKSIQSLLKKEKVIDFAKENKNFVVMEFINENKVKMFLINGYKVVYRQIYNLNDINRKQLQQTIKDNLLTYFKRNDNPSPVVISKDDIDEAHILYHYLKSNQCGYLEINRKWLNPENVDSLEEAINEFLVKKIYRS